MGDAVTDESRTTAMGLWADANGMLTAAEVLMRSVTKRCSCRPNTFSAMASK
jgi:hypothetical protein